MVEISFIILIIIVLCVVDLLLYLGKNIKENNIVVSYDSKEEHQISEATGKFERKVKRIVALLILLVIIQALFIVIQLI